jgi:hypothetical protein
MTRYTSPLSDCRSKTKQQLCVEVAARSLSTYVEREELVQVSYFTNRYVEVRSLAFSLLLELSLLLASSLSQPLTH